MDQPALPFLNKDIMLRLFAFKIHLEGLTLLLHKVVLMQPKIIKVTETQYIVFFTIPLKVEITDQGNPMFTD